MGMKHASHTSQLGRLRRIHGQVGGLVRMVEEERYCADILTQVRAVQGALRRVEQEILKGHIDHCVAGAVEGGDARERQAKLTELYDILERFGA
ncbi:MAG TPA: metal-sensitive transcriptional regulator [Gammaproteobacteria bacterium]|nr:metal-sensitive transcriptional regulator [Gammaproteobacteria bacterium]